MPHSPPHLIGTLDIDSFFEPTWTEKLGERVFQFDAFLSHNHADGSAQLAADLRQHGVTVWHDADADVRDRRVIHAIAQALHRSRYIVVCVHQSFRDSHWVKAEYLNGLAMEQPGLVRVLVAEMEPKAIIPAALEHCPRFAVHAQGYQPLVDQLQQGNRFSTSATVVSPPVMLLSDDQCAWMEEQRKRYPFPDDHLEVDQLHTEQALCQFVARGWENTADRRDATVEFDHLLYAVRGNLCHDTFTQAGPLSEKTLRMTSLLALLFVQSPNVDNRANAYLMLAWLHAKQAVADEVMVELLSRETVDANIKLLVQPLLQVLPAFTPVQRGIVERAVARAPSQLREFSKELKNILGESVRLRLVLSESLDSAVLTIDERLLRIRERLEFLLQGHVGRSDEYLDQLMNRMGISEYEVCCRELTDLLWKYSQPIDYGEQNLPVRREVLSLIAMMVERGAALETSPIIQVGDHLLDHVLPHLLLFVQDDSLRKEAMQTYLAICQILLNSPLAHEVAWYLQGLIHVLKGEPQHDALSLANDRFKYKLPKRKGW